MHWAKTIPEVAYNLSCSGVPPVAPEDFGAQPEDLSAIQLGPYGHPELIELLARRYSAPTDCVVPVPGTSMGNFLALVATIERNDTVLLERPHYQCLSGAIRMFGAQTEFFERNDRDHYAPNAQQIEDGLGRGARAVLISNLHNPTGLRLTDSVLQDLVELTDRHNAALIIDEVYLDYPCVTRGAARMTAATLAPHVVTTSSLTKVYGLGGLRAGWLIANPRRAECVRRAMDHLTVNNAAPSMNLAVRALGNIHRLEERTKDLYRAGWPVVTEWLGSRPDLGCAGNDGATFVFVDLGRDIDAQRLLDLLVRKYDTLVTPGGFFDRPHHVRISFHLAPDRLREALDRIGQAIDELHGRKSQ